jgi:SAM-dependent methyltransferase
LPRVRRHAYPQDDPLAIHSATAKEGCVVPEFFVERARCPVCEERNFTTLYACAYRDDPVRTYLQNFYAQTGEFDPKYVIDAEYIVCHCTTCGLIFQKSIPNAEFMNVIYNQYIKEPIERLIVHDNFTIQTFRLYAQEILDLIDEVGMGPAEIKFLDYGMGFAKWAGIARAVGCNVYGTEISPAKIAYARSQGIIPIAENEIGQHRFNIIHTEQVFEHVPEPLALLNTLTASLADGGLIKINVPSGRGVARIAASPPFDGDARRQARLMPIAPLEHINCFTRPTLERLAAKCGLSASRLRPRNISLHLALPLRRPARTRLLTNQVPISLLKEELKALLSPIKRALSPASNHVILRRSKTAGRSPTARDL